MADLFLRLTRLRQVLTDLLDEFHASSRTGKPVPVEEACQRIEAGFDALSDLAVAAVPPGSRARLEREIADLQRLRALLYDCVARERECVSHLLERVHETRAVLARKKHALEVGLSIDLAG